MANLRRHDQHHLSMPESEHMPGSTVAKAPHTQLSGLALKAAHALEILYNVIVTLLIFLALTDFI